MFIVYILKCWDNSLYTWITTDIERRLKQHRGELVWWAKYTKYRQPIELIYKEYIDGRSLATKREIEIKKLSKTNKLKLITNIKNKLNA